MKNNSMRAASWWIHLRDLDWPSPEAHDRILRRADEFAAAQVNTAMIFGTHFRWDYLPYWTLLHDYMATVREELHQRGIQLFDHHSAVYIHRYDTFEELQAMHLHGGANLVFCPDRASAKSWQYQGHYLNDWRKIDFFTNQVYVAKRYSAEMFCSSNAEFVASYCDYVRKLIADTKIDGLMCDDVCSPVFCGCPACRERFKNWAGRDLPMAEDRDFWGNWDNEMWRHYLSDRLLSVQQFYRAVRAALPGPDYPMTSCASNASQDDNVMSSFELSALLGGDNVVNCELCGITPPRSSADFIPHRVVINSYHAAVAREHEMPLLTIGYGLIPDSVNILWAMTKMLGSNCWVTIPRGRALPDYIADQFGDAKPATMAFTFERDHAELFQGKMLFRCGVLFSEESRRNTAYGSYIHGYTEDFRQLVSLLYQKGLMPGIVHKIPENPAQYPVLLVPSAVRNTPQEKQALLRYLQAGGQVIACGPFDWPGAPQWTVPTRPAAPIENSWREWQTVWGGTFPAVAATRQWVELAPHLLYHPNRLQDDPGWGGELVTQIERFAAPMPGAEIVSAPGFFVTAFEKAPHEVLLFMVAYDFDVKSNTELMQKYQLEIDLLSSAQPTGQNGRIELAVQPHYHLVEAISAPDGQKLRIDAGKIIHLERPSYLIIVTLRSDKESNLS